MASNGKDLEDGLSWTCVVNCQRCSAWHPDGYLLVTLYDGEAFDIYRIVAEPHDGQESAICAKWSRVILEEFHGEVPETGWLWLEGDELLTALNLTC
jgi:hypothetical protein